MGHYYIKGQLMNTFLGTISKQDFLQNYWEKKPLLIKKAVPNIESYVEADDLIDLALDKDFESRIVYNNAKEISAKDGPLKKKDFDKEGWTLACHNLNLLNDDFYDLRSNLDFLPDWLFDDIMATHSKADATIGAHIDKYNVFILQGSGTRKWELELNPDHAYQENISIKILKNFKPDLEWILEPGDMIYIPSGVAHRGTSLTDSISYSLGFKALRTENILQQFLTDLSQSIETEDYLKDQTTNEVSDPFLMPSGIDQYFYKKLQEVTQNPEQFKLWMASYLSTPRNPIEKGEVYLEEEVMELVKESTINRDVFTKVASFKNEDMMVMAINNQTYQLKPESYQKVSKWFQGSPLEAIKINLKQLDQDEWPFLLDQFKHGTFYFEPLE
jgi:50S ribosomal protein L16 3-hydroxylase